MPHYIPQPPMEHPLLTAAAVGFVVVGVGIAGWQMRRNPLTTRWWQPAAVWTVPGLFALMQFITTSANGRMLFEWSPVVCVVFLCWGLLASAQRIGLLHRTVEERFVIGLFSLAIGFGIACLMLAPAVLNARYAARRSSHNCSLKQIGLAMHNYHDTYETLPIPALGDPPSSWRISVLPFLDASDLYKRYQFEASWDADENLPLARTPQQTCTWRDYLDWHDRLGRYYTAVAMLTGPETLWEAGQPVAIQDITDGTSYTILAGEAVGWQIVWTEPRDVDVREVTWDINRPGLLPDISDSLLSSFHDEGAYVLMADGMVRFLSTNIDPDILKALVTPRGHDHVGEF